MIIYCLCIYKCVSSISQGYSICYNTFIYTMDAFRVWPQLTVMIDLIDQSIIVHAQYIHHVLFHTVTFIVRLHPAFVDWFPVFSSIFWLFHNIFDHFSVFLSISWHFFSVYKCFVTVSHHSLIILWWFQPSSEQQKSSLCWTMNLQPCIY